MLVRMPTTDILEDAGYHVLEARDGVEAIELRDDVAALSYADMPRNLDLSLLRAFRAVAETGGMRSASRVLNLTQAAVSLQVKRLEETLGCQLFDRDRRGLRLTGHGERLVAHADRLLRNT